MIGFQIVRLQLSDYKLSDYKLSDYRFPDQLVWNTEVYGPIKFEEIVIFMINLDIGLHFWMSNIQAWVR